MKFLKASLLVSVIFSFGVCINMHRFGYDFEDAFLRTLLTPMEGTVWANGFSEEAFDEVKIGMSMKQVVAYLGEPLRKDSDCSERCFWAYSWQDTQTADFDKRSIVFGPEKLVLEIRKEFFID